MEKCEKCGECCQYIKIHMDSPPSGIDPKYLELYRAHGIKEMVARQVTLKLKHRCQFLTDANICAIYDSRPQMCREFFCKKPDREEESEK